MTHSDRIDQLFELVPYVTVLEHQPGELQLKFSLSVLKGPDFSGLKGLAHTLPGIADIRVNLLSRTIKIIYDVKHIGFDFWESLFALKEHPERKPDVLARLRGFEGLGKSES